MYAMKYFELNLYFKNTMFILNYDFKVHFKVSSALKFICIKYNI